MTEERPDHTGSGKFFHMPVARHMDHGVCPGPGLPRFALDAAPAATAGVGNRPGKLRRRVEMHQHLLETEGVMSQLNGCRLQLVVQLRVDEDGATRLCRAVP